MTGETEGKLLFQALRPLCVEIMNNLSVESLNSLQARLEELSSPLPTPLVPYITIPLRAAIKRTGSSNQRLLEHSLLSLAAVFSRVREMDIWELFQDIFPFTCMLLDCKMAREAGFEHCSEDLLLSALRALRALLLCSSSLIHEKMCSDLVALGHCISVLLSSATDSSSNTQRQEALSTLCALTGLDTGPVLSAAKELQMSSSTDLSAASSKYLGWMREVVGVAKVGGAAMASFLPGIVLALTRMVTTDAKTPGSVTSLTLLTWAHYVGVVMGGEEQEVGVVGAKRDKLLDPDKAESLMVDRSEVWRKKTAENCKVLIQRMCLLVTSDVVKVRVSLVGWAHSLLSHIDCTSGMEVCVPPLLEVLVTLSHDVYPQVSSTAHSSLQLLPRTAQELSLTSMLGEQLHSLVTSLPRLIRQHDDTRKVATLQLLAGYLQLSGKHVSLVVHSLPHLSRLVQGLLQALTLEKHTSHVMTTSLPSLTPSTLSPGPLSLPHANFHSDKVAVLLKEVCTLLGCRGDPSALLDYLMDQFALHSDLSNECLLFIAYLLPGTIHCGCGHAEATPTSLSPSELYNVVERIVTVLVEPRNWSRSHDPLSGHTSKGCELFTFLLINVIFTSVHLLKSTFDPLLQQLIYPLMQRLGDGNMDISETAKSTLLAVCVHCGYQSLSALINHNADYLVHTISIHLRMRSYRESQPEAVQVLTAMVSHSEEEVCLLVKDSIADLLLSLDTGQMEARLIWTGLRALAERCVLWIDQRQLKGVESGGVAKEVKEEETCADVGVAKEEERRDVGIKAIAEYFQEYHERKEREKEAGNEVGSEPLPEEEMKEGEEESYSTPKLPAPEQACVDVLRRCVHHMANQDPGVRLVVLETMQHCMKALRHDKLILYPEVHLVWAPLLPRLTDHAHPVARRAWQVVQCVCEVSGDFVKKRILEKVWPVLLKSLESMATTSARATGLYHQSAQCKLQCVLLESLAQLCTSLSIPSRHFELGALAALHYLHSDQPCLLQTTAVSCFKTLLSVNADIIWLVLQQLVPLTDMPLPPPPPLKPFKLATHKDSSKYAENVKPLLSLTFKVP